MHAHPTIALHLDERERHMVEIAVEIFDDGFLTKIAARLQTRFRRPVQPGRTSHSL